MSLRFTIPRSKANDMGSRHGANPFRTQSLPCTWFGESRKLTLGQPHLSDRKFPICKTTWTKLLGLRKLLYTINSQAIACSVILLLGVVSFSYYAWIIGKLVALDKCHIFPPTLKAWDFVTTPCLVFLLSGSTIGMLLFCWWESEPLTESTGLWFLSSVAFQGADPYCLHMGEASGWS